MKKAALFVLLAALTAGAAAFAQQGYWRPPPPPATSHQHDVRVPGLPPSRGGFGIRCDGVNDDTAALQEALDTTRVLRLPAGGQCRINHTLNVPSGAEITSQGGSGWIVLGTRQGELGDGPGGGPNGPVDFGIRVDHASNVSLHDFGVRMEYRDGIIVHAIAIFNSGQVTVQHVDIKDLADGYGVIMRSSHDVLIDGNHLHDFRLNAAPRCGLDPPEFAPTRTRFLPGLCGKIIGIKVDSGQRSYAEAYNIRITNNLLENMDVGPDFERLWGHQAEGMNIAGPQDSDDMPLNLMSHDILVQGNTLRHMGAGINSYAYRVRIQNNTVTDVAEFGIKILHGAQENTVTGNRIDRAGYAGIYIRGHVRRRSTAHNTIDGNTITNLGRDSFVHRFRGDWTEGRPYGVYCTVGFDNMIGQNSVDGRGPRDSIEPGCGRR